MDTMDRVGLEKALYRADGGLVLFPDGQEPPEVRFVENWLGSARSFAEDLINPDGAIVLHSNPAVLERKVYHSFGTAEDTQSGKSVLTGKLGALKYILDPRLFYPLTPGFHDFTLIEPDMVIGQIGSTKYAITPNGQQLPDLDQDQRRVRETQGNYPRQYSPESVHNRFISKKGYPEFLFNEYTVLRSLDRRTSVPSPFLDTPDNTLGLETSSELHPNEKATRQLFDAITRGVFAHASKDKKQLNRLKDPTQTLYLPRVETDELRGQMTMETFPEGQAVISFLAPGENGQLNRGFFLIRDLMGATTLVPANLQSPDINSALYENNVKAAKTYAERYFELIKVDAALGSVEADTMFELRRKIGQMSTRQARRHLKALDK